MATKKGQELLDCIKKRQRAEALELLGHKLDVTVTDQSGRTALHLAAVEGYDEILEKLIQAGAEVECWDNSGQTPMHKAARDGHVKALVILVAHGALVNTMDWRGCPPIEMALINHHLRAIEVLFGFGAFLQHHHWDWMNKKNLNAKDKMMREMVVSHSTRVPGFKYGGIDWKLVHVETKCNIELEDLKLTLTPTSRIRHPFYLYCCRMQSDYSNMESLLSQNDHPFSDAYEIRDWKMTMKSTFTLVIIVEGQPKVDQEVVLGSSGAENAAIEMVERSVTDETTHVTLTVTLVPNVVVTLILGIRERSPETFVISNEALKINPEGDDTASIDIPEGTFESPTPMSLHVTQTKPNNTNGRRESIKTNIWDLKLDNKLQKKSNEPMEVHLHIHVPPDKREDLAFVTTNGNTEDEEDWHVIKSQSKTSKGVIVKCTFNKRLSIGGVSKKMLSENRKQVTEELNHFKDNMHDIVFLVMTKLQDLHHNVFSLVVDCGTTVNTDRNRNRWLREGYDKESRSRVFTVKDCQVFKMTFKDLNETPVTLTFQSHRKSHNYRMMEFVVPNGKTVYHDEIVIESVTEVQPEAVVEVVSGSGCCSMKEKKLVLPKPIKRCEKLCSLPVYVKYPPVYSSLQPNKDNFSDLDEDDECMISVLRYSSLKALSEAMTLSDGKHIASQLRISQPINYEIMKRQTGDHVKVFQILAMWRGQQPYLAMVDTLIYSLRSCNRHDLADRVVEAAKLNNILRSVPDVAKH